MTTCQRCGLPQQEPPGVAYAGLRCRCWARYAAAPVAPGAVPLRALTEKDVRRIVREELAAEKEENRRKLRAFVAEVHGAGDAMRKTNPAPMPGQVWRYPGHGEDTHYVLLGQNERDEWTTAGFVWNEESGEFWRAPGMLFSDADLAEATFIGRLPLAPTSSQELPPLPEPDNSYVIDGPDRFNAKQMHAYARAAIAQATGA